jgi:filamentous hemagglutinin family protein
VSLHGSDITVGADLGQTRGGNLFHSFERFDVETGGQVTFTGPDRLRNVISRVTGGEPSSIDGTLASSIPKADFYLLNPAGILLGPNAQLDVKGAFHASTADELRFADGAVFSALDGQGSTLTVADPQAFGFLGANASPIAVMGSVLTVPSGEALSLTGSDVIVDAAGLLAPDGALALVAASGPATVNVGASTASGQLSGNIGLLDGAAASVSGIRGAGHIWIRGGEIVVANQVRVFAGNFGEEDSRGGIDVDGGSVRVIAGSVVSNDVFGAGRTGELALRGNEIEISGGSRVGSLTAGQADAPAVGLVGESVRITDGAVRSSANAGSTGNAGPVTITADALEIGAGGLIGSTTFAAGDAGSVAVDARDLSIAGEASGLPTGISAEAGPMATGNAGRITIRSSGQVAVRSGGTVGSTTTGPGEGGAVEVDANKLVISRDGAPFATGISAQAGPGSTANAGTVRISANDLLVENGSTIESSTFAAGSGGEVVVAAGHLRIVGDQSPFLTGIAAGTSSDSTGDAGSVAVSAAALEISDGGEISSGTLGTGDAGPVSVASDDLVLRRGGSISSATSSAGQGGPVTVGAGRLFVIGSGSGSPTGVLAQANRTSAGSAGQVAVTTEEIELRQGGQISTATFGSGSAGQVRVRTSRLLIDSDGAAVATGILSDNDPGSLGNAGSVLVMADDLTVQDGGRISSFTGSSGTGGDVSVDAARLTIDAQGSPFLTGIAAAALPGSTGDAGAIIVRASDLSIRDQGVVTSTSRGSGRAGNVRIHGGDVRLEDAAVRTAGIGTEGGRISMAADERIYLRRSETTSSGIEAAAGASVISLAAPQIVLNASTVTSLTGDGQPLAGSGEASLLGDATVISADSLVAGSSSVVISGLQTNLGSDLQLAPAGFLDVSRLLRESCAATGGAPRSTFTRGGRGGLPPGPDRPLPSAGVELPPAAEPPATEASIGWVFLDACALSPPAGST